MVRRPWAAASKNGWISGLSGGAGMARCLLLMTSLPTHDQRGAAVAGAQRATRAVRQRDVTVLDLDLGMGLAAELTHGLDDLGHAPAVRRMVVAETAAVGIEGKLPHPGDEVAVGDELAALPLGAEAEILEGDEHGDGEAVVDRDVLDVGLGDAGLGEGGRSRPHGA